MFCKTHSGDRWAEGRPSPRKRRNRPPQSARRSSNGVDDKGKNKGEARALGRRPRTDPETTKKGNAGVSDRQRRVADRVAARHAPVGRRRPFLGRPAIAQRLGKASGRCSRRPASAETNARVWRRWTTRRARRSSRGSSRRGTPKSTTRSRGSRRRRRALPVAAPSPFPRFAADRDGPLARGARLAGLGGVVANGVGAGKRLATLGAIFCIFATGWDSEGRTSSRVRGKTPRRGSPISTGGVRNCERCRSRVPRTSGRPPRRRRCARGDRRRHRADGRVDRIGARSSPRRAEKEMKAEKEAKEVKAGGEGRGGGEHADGSRRERVRTRPRFPRASQEIGQDAQILLRSSLARQGGRERRRSPRRRASHVLPLSHRGRGRATRRRRSPRSPRRRPRVASSIPASSSSAARYAPAPPSTPTPRESLRAALALVLPEPFAAADAVGRPSTRARAAQKRTTPTPRRSPRRRRRPTRFSVLFYASTTTPENGNAMAPPTHETIVRVRVARAAVAGGDGVARVAALSATLPRLRAGAAECSSSRRRGRRSTRRPRRSGRARRAVRLDVASRGARLHAAARFRADASPSSTSRRLRVGVAADAVAVSRKMW